MEFTEIKTADEYKDLVTKYSWLVDSELKIIELNIKEHPDNLDMNIESLPKLISLVNVVGYLRGQNNAFIEVRPDDVVEYQSELYKNEDAFESRLHTIITTICVDPKNLELCKSTIERHFIEYRLKK